jgi:DNA-binding transcriptional MerR regulator
MTEDTRRPLVGTGEAAEQCGVARTTLARWAAEGLVTPAAQTAGGHLRWDLDQLKAQLDQIARSRKQKLR